MTSSAEMIIKPKYQSILRSVEDAVCPALSNFRQELIILCGVYVCLYMCFALSVYVCVCMWYVHRCMYKCGLKGRPRKIMCDCLPLSLSPFVFKLAYLAMEPQRPTCVCLQMLGLQAHKAVSSLFTWVPGVWTPILIPSPQDLVLFVKINKSIHLINMQICFFP